jgi:fructose-1,6-bisphosphatase/inositol monophosphatase family enzyme
VADWLEIGQVALRAACDELDQAKNVTLKDQDNIKIAADLVMHSAILGVLKTYNQPCIVYSEESLQPEKLGAQPEVEIVVDPLDGSYFFLKGNRGLCSTGLMVIRNGQPMVSVVRALESGHTYYCDAQQSYRNGRRIKVSKSVAGPPAVLVWAPMKELFTQTLHRLDPLARDCRIFTSCGLIHAAQMTEGYYDAVLEMQPVPLYELCGAVIAWRAGATLSTLEGKDIVFDPKVRQTLLVTRSVTLHERILSCF